MRHKVELVVATLLILGTAALPVHADDRPVKNKGLYITPLRHYVDSDAGTIQHGSFTVGNYTNSTINVTFFAEQFSVADYTYDLMFESPSKEDWTAFDTAQSTLKPYQSQSIGYTVRIPHDATPGGHYFTLFAKTTIQNGSLTSNLQTASMLYLTINGNLTRSSSIQKNSAPWIVFGDRIPYQLTVKNMGNTHFFVYVSGQLQGFSAKPREPAEAHILLPGSIRSVGGSVSAPQLPGVYKVVYGYKTDYGQTVERSNYLLYAPPWSILFLIGLGVVLWPFLKRKRKSPTGS